MTPRFPTLNSDGTARSQTRFDRSEPPPAHAFPAATRHDQINVHLTDKVLGISAQTVITGPTCRPAVVVLWSSIGKPFIIRSAHGEQIWTGNAAVIAPNFVRTLCATDCHIISVNFEPNHSAMASLSSSVGATGILPIDHRRVKAFSDDLRAAISGQEGTDIDSVACELARWLSPQKGSRRDADHRVQAILKRLDDDLCTPPSVQSLAREAGLSANRISHLLATEIGMPYRSYVLWRKYRRALALLHEPQSLSWVAQFAGFYDQAHMARTFVNYFGYSPTAVRKQGFVLSRP